jgi:hypothetical protein
VPDLQVAEVFAAEAGRGRRGAQPSRPPPDRVWRTARRTAGTLPPSAAAAREEGLEHDLDLGHGERFRRLQRQVEIPIPGTVLRERLQLKQHRRHQVEGDPQVGKLAGQRDHPVVVLHGMEPDPRQQMLARHEVFVEGLMHVPQDGDASHKV